MATPVEQTFPHEPQSAGLLVVSTHVPEHSVGAADRQPDTHEYVPPEFEQTGVAPVQALLHAPQLVAVVRGTHAPLQSVYPAWQAKVQALCTQTGAAFVTLVVHALPQAPQLFASLVSSTHVPEPRHCVGAVMGQPLRQVEFEHTGVGPVHTLPQLPQFAVVFRSVHAPLQRFVPLAQTVLHAPATHAGWVLATLVVHTLPHVRQLFGSLTVSTHVPEQVVGALEGQVATHA